MGNTLLAAITTGACRISSMAGRELTIAVVALLFGCAPPPESRISSLVIAPMDWEELLLGLSRSSTDDLIYTLNELKKSDASNEMISLIECAYELCSQSHVKWNVDGLSDPLVRVNLLDVIVQNSARG